MNPNKITMSEWRAVIEAAQVQADTVPPGWKTCAELAEAHGISREQMARIMRQAGPKVQMRRFRVHNGQRVYPVPHYRPVSAAKSSARLGRR